MPIRSREFGDARLRRTDCKEDDTSNGCAILVNGAAARWFASSHGIVDITGFKAAHSTGRSRWAGGITSSATRARAA